MTDTFEYKVVIYRESMLGSLFLGGSKVDPVKFSEFLNTNGAQGWEVKTMERESRVRKSPNPDAVCFHAQQCVEKYFSFGCYCINSNHDGVASLLL